jgi:hypothetical protein
LIAIVQRPSGFSDLERWSVYADWMIGEGDRRGELIALELSLPATASRRELVKFKQLHERTLRRRDSLHVGHALAHAREVALPESYVRMGGRVPPSTSALASLTDLLASDTFALIERLQVVYAPSSDSHWERLFAAVPPTVERMSIDLLGHLDDDDVRRVRDLVRARNVVVVREAFGADAAPFIDDRFESVEVERATPAVLEAFARTSRVRVLVRDGAIPTDARIGYAGLASLRGSHRARAFQAWGALALELHYGPVPIRAQLAGDLAEWHQFADFDVVRRGDSWTFRSHLRFRHRGQPCAPSSIVKLEDGDVLEVGEQRYVFALHPRV